MKWQTGKKKLATQITKLDSYTYVLLPQINKTNTVFFKKVKD